MNIYLLAGTQLGYTPALLLIKELPIKGLIGLADNEENIKQNEYYNYDSFCKKEKIEYIPMGSYSINNLEDQNKLIALEIDIIIIASWQRLLPDWLIHHCKIGVIGSHGSAEGISKGRGRSPQNWAIMLGSNQFELSIFWVDTGIDSGNIIDTAIINYSEADDIFSSYIKIGLAMADMLINNFRNGKLARKEGTPQLNADCQYCPQRTADDGMIDWTRSAKSIHNFIRALSRPYPGAFSMAGNRKIIIWNAQYINEDSTVKSKTPGEIIVCFPTGQLLIKCGSGLLIATNFEGKSGIDLKIGTVLESADYRKQIEEIIIRHNQKYDFPISRLIINSAKY